MTHELSPYGFSRLPDYNGAKGLRRLRYWLIRQLACGESVIMNCSTGDGVTIHVDQKRSGPGLIAGMRLCVGPERPHLRRSIHICIMDDDDGDEAIAPVPVDNETAR